MPAQECFGLRGLHLKYVLLRKDTMIVNSIKSHAFSLASQTAFICEGGKKVWSQPGCSLVSCTTTFPWDVNHSDHHLAALSYAFSIMHKLFMIFPCSISLQVFHL